MARLSEEQLLEARLTLPGLCDAIHAAYWLRNGGRDAAETYAGFAEAEMQKLSAAFGYRLVPLEAR